MINLRGSIGAILAFIAMVGMIYTLAAPDWNIGKIPELSDSTLIYYEGLWVRCSTPIPGRVQCDSFNSATFKLPDSFIAIRTMMILSTLFAISGVVAAFLGLDIIPMGKMQKVSAYTGGVGGAVLMLAAVLTHASIYWYSSQFVVNQQQNTASSKIVIQLGPPIYVGFEAGIFAFMAGVLLIVAYFKPSNTGGQKSAI